MSLAPPLKRGWLKKYSRSGLLKNWQTRYFVINHGKISYYQNQIDRFPYGEDFKGELALFQATVSIEHKKISNERQVYVVGANGEKDLLLEAESEAEVQQWLGALQAHIEYAQMRRSSIAAPGVSTTAQSSAGYERGASEGSAEDRGTTETIVVTPSPGFVIKVLRTNGEKIFVNVCEAQEIPMTSLTLGYNKWPFMVLTPLRTIGGEDEAGGELSCYDAVVNPAVLVTCSKNPEAKDATCARVLRLLRKKYGEQLTEEYKLPKIQKRYKGEIQAYAIPADIQRVSKTQNSIHVAVAPPGGALSISAVSSSSSSSDVSKRRTSVLDSVRDANTPPSPTAAASSASAQTQAQTLPPRTPSLQGGAQTTMALMSARGAAIKAPQQAYNGAAFLRRKSESGTSSNSTSTAPANSSSSSAAPGVLTRMHTATGLEQGSAALRLFPAAVEANAAPAGPRGALAFVCVRSNGTAVRCQPDKLAVATQSLGGNGKVLVVARRYLHPGGAPSSSSSSAEAGGAVWLRTSEGGWVTERVSAGSTHRVLVPCLFGQPSRAQVVSSRFLYADSQGGGGGGKGRQSLSQLRHSTGSAHAPRAKGSALRSSYGGRATTVSESGWKGFRASAVDEEMAAEDDAACEAEEHGLDLCFTLRLHYSGGAQGMEPQTLLRRRLTQVLALQRALLSFGSDAVLVDRVKKAGELCVSGVHYGGASGQLYRDDDAAHSAGGASTGWWAYLFGGATETGPQGARLLQVRDVHALLETVESVEQFLTRLLQSVSLDKCRCKALADFFAPSEAAGDWELAEHALSGGGGLCAAWPEADEEVRRLKTMHLAS